MAYGEVMSPDMPTARAIVEAKKPLFDAYQRGYEDAAREWRKALAWVLNDLPPRSGNLQPWMDRMQSIVDDANATPFYPGDDPFEMVVRDGKYEPRWKRARR